MASQGPLSPGTLADDATVGLQPWTDPTNAASSNDSYTTASMTVSVSHYLKATNFGFSVPTGATITGILVEIEKSKTGGAINNATDNIVKIVKSDGTIGTEDKKLAGTWPTTDAYYSYGSLSDLWSETWTYSDINDADFGVVISA